MFFFSKKNKEETVAVFDISSGSVGGSIFLVKQNSKPTIVSSCRNNFKDSSNQNVDSMLSALEKTANFLQKDIHAVPDKVFAVVSSPWSTGQLRNIKRHRKESFVFTEKFAKNLIKEEIEKFKNENTGFDEIIDRRTVNVLLNGFEAPRPNGKRVKESEIHVFLSLSSKEIIERIEKVIMNTYQKSIKFTSSFFADFIVARDIFDNLNDFVILDIHEDSTEISVMQNDFLVGTASLPYGKNTLISHVAKGLGKNPTEVAPMLSMYKDGHLDDLYAEKIEELVYKEGFLWIEGLKKVFRSLSTSLLIPHDIFFISDKSSSAWFLKLLTKSNFSEFTTTENSFNVILADSKNMHEFYKGAMHIKYDSRLTIQSIFINNIINK